MPQFSYTNLDKNHLIFKPTEVGKETIKLSNNSNDELIKCLTKQIEQLDISLKPSTLNTKLVNVITQTSTLINSNQHLRNRTLK